MNRQQLEEIPAGTELLRAVRHMPVESFDDFTVDELDNAARWLRAASYSATEGARRIETAIAQRKHEGSQSCTSDSNPTATNTNSAGHPPADQ